MDSANNENSKRLVYTIGPQLEQGTFASIHMATCSDKKGNIQKMACKIIDKKKNEEFVNTFLPRELEILKKIKHPHVTKIFDIVDKEDKVYILMMLAEKGDLYKFLKTNGPVNEKIAFKWFTEILSGIEYLHNNGIAHRDLKCENILLTHNYHIVITDFGFATYSTESNKHFSETYCGSLAYAAPEIIKRVPYDPKVSDIWSLGIILFIVVNGTFPFDDSNIAVMLMKQNKRKYTFNIIISNECKNLIYRILESDPKMRCTLEFIKNHVWMKKYIQLIK